MKASFSVKNCAALSVLFWCCYLFLQGGDWWNETEHCNTAWMIGKMGLHPFTDFFQHHSPMLWDILSLFYKLGGQDVGILFFGRGFVVLCALCCAYSLWRVNERNSFSEKGVPFTLCLILFVSYTVGLETLFVIRPETLSVALGALSLAAWHRFQSRGH